MLLESSCARELELWPMAGFEHCPIFHSSADSDLSGGWILGSWSSGYFSRHASALAGDDPDCHRSWSFGPAFHVVRIRFGATRPAAKEGSSSVSLRDAPCARLCRLPGSFCTFYRTLAVWRKVFWLRSVNTHLGIGSRVHRTRQCHFRAGWSDYSGCVHQALGPQRRSVQCRSRVRSLCSRLLLVIHEVHAASKHPDSLVLRYEYFRVFGRRVRRSRGDKGHLPRDRSIRSWSCYYQRS